MKRLNLGRYALSIGATATLLAGCGGSQPPIGAPAIRSPIAPRATSSSLKVLHRFNGADGAGPAAPVIDVDGTFYGTTFDGGSSNLGTVYSLGPTGVEKVLHSFTGGSDGAHPDAGLVDVHGTMYGTTSIDSLKCPKITSPYCGTLFSITPSGVETVLHEFDRKPDGMEPRAGLIDVKGTMYGTTCRGGDGSGTVYTISTSGVEKVLYRFGSHKSDGFCPSAPLVDVDGKFYGTTLNGGAHSSGTVFSLTMTGVEKVLHTFKGDTSPSDGAYPQGALIDVNGKLYGTTNAGGTGNCPFNDFGGCGTVFSITTSGSEKIVHNFDGDYAPAAGLVYVKGLLYGTTEWNGWNFSGFGTLFSLSLGGNYTMINKFGSKHGGKHPQANLIYKDGTLYGTTWGDFKNSCAPDCGTVFALTP